MLEEIREQRDRWQQQAERLAALAITDQRKEN
jgi:predicted flap endonuclease-1-like 5' DNA nuclease